MSPREAVERLLKADWSEARIAAAVGTSQPTIHRIKRGLLKRGVTFELGTALIDLAAGELAGAAGPGARDQEAA